jgi:cell wall-associated NlpC family hydrolase
VRRTIRHLLAAACVAAAAVPAIAAGAPAINDPGWKWAAPAMHDLVANHGWPAADATNLGRITTRRELARAVAELMISRGQSAPAGLVAPPDITPTDPDATAISWVTSARLVGAPGVAFGPNTTVTGVTAEVAITRVLGLGTQITALNTLHTADGTRLPVPSGFGAQVLAAELGLRHNYPFATEKLETATTAPMPLAEMAGMIDGAIHVSSWDLASVQNFAGIMLPNLTPNQRTVIQNAITQTGAPYIWGGTSPLVQGLWGSTYPGGFDCSGLVWWAFKLGPGTQGLGSDIVGRTADNMAWERPSQRVAISALRPGDLVFFGPNGPHSPRGSISHVAISIGNGWIVQSTGSRDGVTVTHLSGYWDSGVAWGRRPAAMGSVPSTGPMTPARWGALAHFIHGHFAPRLRHRTWTYFTSHPTRAYTFVRAHRLG